MSIPKFSQSFTLTDFILEKTFSYPGFYYKIHNKEKYLADPLHSEESLLATITIPPICEEPRMKLGVFLEHFDTILCELLVIYDREVVGRLFGEVMEMLFPEEAENFELGFYEFRGGTYSKIDYSQNGYKKIFGKEREGKSFIELAKDSLPPKRTMFQEHDEIWEEFWKKRQEAKELRRKRHPRRTVGLRSFIE